MTDISHHAAQLNEVRQRLDEHGRRITSLEVHTAGEKVRMENIDTRLTDLQSGVTWANRLIMGAILLGVVGFMLRGGFYVGS